MFSRDDHQSLSVQIGNNSGSIQSVASGGDSYVTHQHSQGDKSENLSQEDVIGLLNNIVAIIRESGLPAKDAQRAEMYVELSKSEAASEQPNKEQIYGNLKGAIELLKNLGTTIDESSSIIAKLKDPVIKLSGWLGLALFSLL